MSENASFINSDKIIREDKSYCVSDKWCFDHTGLASIREYDKNINNCCTCLDFCTWCFEFRTQKNSILCKKDTNCYLCCCSIYFE
jgi:hypothetical protein